MRKVLLGLVASLLLSPAFAADNAVIVTPGVGVTMKSTDVGAGVQSMQTIPSTTGGVALPSDSTNGLGVNVKACASGVCGVARTTAITNVSPIAGEVHTSAPAYTNLDSQPPSMTVRGGYWVNMDSVAGTALGTPTNFGTSPGAVVASSTNASIMQGTTAVVAEPCQTAAKTYLAISQATSTQLFAGTSAKKTYVCHFFIIGADAENVSLVSGTGSVCGTNTVAMIGGTSAANGPNLAANSGFATGSGASSVAASTVNADNVCLLQSGSGRIAGVMTYVSQ